MKLIFNCIALLFSLNLFGQSGVIPIDTTAKNYYSTSKFKLGPTTLDLDARLLIQISPSTSIDFNAPSGRLSFEKDGSLKFNGELLAKNDEYYKFAKEFTEWLAPILIEYYKYK